MCFEFILIFFKYHTYKLLNESSFEAQQTMKFCYEVWGPMRFCMTKALIMLGTKKLEDQPQDTFSSLVEV